MSAPAGIKERLREIMGWVTEALDGLGHLAEDDRSLLLGQAVYKQAVLFDWHQIEGRDRAEVQDVVLDCVKRALMRGIDGVRSRDGAWELGWRVIGARDLSAHPQYEPSMPQYSVWIEWRGPKPETWPLMMHLGQAENGLSYPVGVKPEWN